MEPIFLIVVLIVMLAVFWVDAAEKRREYLNKR
jgi:hypothetical protein